MARAPSPLRRSGAPLVAVVVLLVVLAPILLFSDSPGALGLIFVAAGLLGGGLFVSRAGGADVRSAGRLLAVVGVVLLIAAIVLLVLVLGGLGRPF